MNPLNCLGSPSRRMDSHTTTIALLALGAAALTLAAEAEDAARAVEGEAPLA